MLPILPSTQASPIELQPWLLLHRNETHELSAALWNIDNVGEAIVIFSSYDKAAQYNRLFTSQAVSTTGPTNDAAHSTSHWQIQQPTELELGKILVAGYSSGLRWIVLDPTASDAQLIYPLADVLKAFRKHLTSIRRSHS